MAKVLTVCQPFSWAIIHGGKNCENRPWRTRYRGELLIHAGKSREWLAAVGTLPIGVVAPSLDELHFGAIIGSVELVDCVPVAEVAGNPWSFGPWCWILEGAKAMEPIKCSGKQGLWDVTIEPVITSLV